MLLNIKDLHVSINGKEILKGFNLSVNKGEVHAIMGPNGTGKSTLAAAITGREGYEITQGEIWFKGELINDMSPDERANKGVFLSFQYPVEIPGVSMTNFMRTALNAKQEYMGLAPISAGAFLKKMEEKKKLVEIHSKLTNRSVNEGFSGGEKKKNEIFQMAMLEPTLAILDETDSGLDIDALKVVAKGVNALRSEDNGFVVITHYQRLLDFIVPDFVHVMYDGRLVKSGGKELALELEAKGYDWIKEANEVK
jgi:Fe-S cluster assembly ATP-binding protein